MASECSILRARVLFDDEMINDGVVVMEGERIRATGPVERISSENPDLADAIAQTPWRDAIIIPGLVDVHCHGGGGESFPNAETRDQAMVAVMEHRRHGTTSLVASCVTAAADVLLRRGRLLGELSQDGELAGVHYEGPFVSHERKGAQDPTFIIAPDPELTRQLLEAAGGHAVTMTLAPEKDKAYGPGSVAEVLISGGALPSWGHTDADPFKARHALEFSRECLARTPVAQRRSPRATVTHLFNGMRPLHHRDPGPIMEFLSDAARGGAVVEMICDGVHLDPELVHTVVETVGRGSCVLVTDAMAACGMADGSYVLGPQEVTVKDGIALLTKEDTIAGGTAHLLDCVRTAVQKGGIDLADAVFMATAQGAAILGRSDIGSLESGCRADVLVLDEDLRALEVWFRGSRVE
ncbi:amidohydrolase family protein [Schaalia sp. 19OD2882]|uniref:N-acetylglucosamine-6-phosphate deacetylase n=1 Tax=Schaalia sp. 19OD2882 TaxID=2794089 RepID=UPI001C1EE0C0|nr:amidohydrolase family protein [Schaalia sp. 19OD2882]QWW20366.1 amidohydrolase family protein [Schaalia sp. 19OD2882]